MMEANGPVNHHRDGFPQISPDQPFPLLGCQVYLRIAISHGNPSFSYHYITYRDRLQTKTDTFVSVFGYFSSFTAS